MSPSFQAKQIHKEHTVFQHKHRNDLKGSECSDTAQVKSGAHTCSNLAEF